MLQATATPLEGNRVKLTVEVTDDEFASAIEHALEELGTSIRLPGFRPGRAPKKLIEARVGRDAVRQEALKEHLPGYLRRAAADTGTDVIGAPELDVTSTPSDSVLRFDAVVETRPRPAIPGYEGLRVTVPSPEATAQEIDRQIDRMREQFGELSVVSRPARDGDHATIDLKAHRHSTPVDELTVDDFVYEIGSGGLVEGLDGQLQSARAGDILKFNSHAHTDAGRSDIGTGDDEITLQVLVKEVKEKVLPPADDAWAADASEFSTITELRDDIARQIGEVKRVQARLALRSGAARELAALVPEEPPEVLVSEELQLRLMDLQRRLDAQRATFDQYLLATGQDPQHFMDSMRSAAADTVKLDLALRSLADAERIEASDTEVADRLADLAKRSGQSAAALRRRFESGDGLDAVGWEIRKTKALEWLVGHVEVVDESGTVVDPATWEDPEDAGATGDEPREGGAPMAGERAGRDSETSTLEP